MPSSFMSRFQVNAFWPVGRDSYPDAFGRHVGKLAMGWSKTRCRVGKPDVQVVDVGV
jgi:hypothetical protein